MPDREGQGWDVDGGGLVLELPLSTSKLSCFLPTQAAAGCLSSPKPPSCAGLKWNPAGRKSD